MVFVNRIAVFLALAGVISATGAAQDDKAAAQAEIERQLRASTAETPPPSIEVNFVPIDQGGYRLEELRVSVDGNPVTAPKVETLSTKQKLFGGEVKEGRHEVVVGFVYAAAAGPFSYMTGYKFRLAPHMTIIAKRGLLTSVDVGAHVDNNVDDWKLRVKPSLKEHTTMLAKLDDGDLPPPPVHVEPKWEAPPAAASADQSPPAAESAASSSKRSNKRSRSATKALREKPAAAPVKVAMADEPNTAASVTPPHVAEPVAAPIAIATPAPVAAVAAAVDAKSGDGKESGVLLLVAGGVLVAAGLAIALWRRRKPVQLPPE
jgi:hypothetical protein